MLLAYILCALACAAGVMFVKRAGADKLFAGAFYVVQAAFAVWLLCGNTGTSQLGFFTMDTTGTLFFTLTALTSPIVWYHGLSYLDRETDRQKRIYNTLLILLCVSIALVYFSDNAAVTWIFL